MSDHIHTCHMRCTNTDCVERTRLELQKVCAEKEDLLKRIDQYETMLDTGRGKMERMAIERDDLRTALNDAIHSPMGVVPVSAHPFYDWEAGKVKP